MLHINKNKTSKTMGKEAVRWQILTIAFLSVFIGVFCFAGNAAATHYNISINDISVNENAGTADFTVTLSNLIADGDVVAVDFTTAGVTATKGSDFDDPGTLSIMIFAGSTGMISVPILPDTLYEGLETFNVDLPSCGVVSGVGSTVSITDNQGTGMINDDPADRYEVIDLDDVTVDESVGTANFTVTLNKVVEAGDTVTINFTTAGVTATKGSDFDDPGPLSIDITAGNTTGTIPVTIINDPLYEGPETYTVDLTGSSANAFITDNQGIGTINNDPADRYEVIDLDDVTVDESVGTANFTVTLNKVVEAGDTVTINFTTAGVTATKGSDFDDPGPLSIDITAGNTTGTIPVTIINDPLYEGPETYTVDLTGSSANAFITDNQGIGTINNDPADRYEVIDLDDVTVDESVGTANFTVTLNKVVEAGDTVTINFTTAGVTATKGSDFDDPGPLSIDITAGNTTGTIPVTIINDPLYEGPETYTVDLTGSSANAFITDAQGIGTINNDPADRYEVIDLDDVTVDESVGTANFTVTLNKVVEAGDTVTINFTTAGVTATKGSDFDDPGPLSIDITAGNTTGTIPVTIINDPLYEGPETYTVNLTGSSANAFITDNQGIGTINNDPADTYDVSIEASKSVLESAGSVVFTVTLDQQVFEVASVAYATADGTATAGSDYTATSGTVDIAAGDTTGTITIPIIDDIIDDNDETFNIILTPGAHQTVSNSPATCTITDNDVLLTLNKTGDDLAVVVTDDGNITANGSHAYPYGVDVPISATPSGEGFVFDHWDGDVAEPLLPQTTVPMLDNKTVTAVFVGNTYALHMAITGEGSVTPSVGIHNYSEGNIVDLIAVPATDWAFNYWVGDVADPTNPNTTVTMNTEQTVTAFFITTIDPDVDHDGDGYTPNAGDCNDNDATVHPNATEICGDGIDQNCDGLDTSCDVDNDGDGYLASINPLDPSYDCNDNDSSIHPGATEICDDGIDQDCDGSDLACTGNDLDLDGDGYSVNMGDCNDDPVDPDAPFIHPGATEICGDGLDNDCYDGERACQASEVKCVDISDTPLDTQVSAAPANIMFVLDDSGSMDWEFTTNESDGLFESEYYPFDNPGDNAYWGQILTDAQRAKWKSQWSGHNKMYYDSASIYTPWPNHSGTGNLPDADPDNPRSNPINATPTFNLNSVYLSINTQTLRVNLTRENAGGACADAVRFQGTTNGVDVIVDNSEPGFTNSGYWYQSSGQPGWDPSIPGPIWAWGYSLYSNSTGSLATWQPVIPSGTYNIYAWWTSFTSRTASAPYRIYDGDGTLSNTVSVDQRNNGGQWNLLSGGPYNLTYVAPGTQDIIRAHYYVWDDNNSNGVVDNLEIYLVELNGAITYYQFNDPSGSNSVDSGVLTQVFAPNIPDSIIPKDENGAPRTYAQERQNFANWYSFYRKREYTAKAAVGRVISDMTGVNIGIKCINNDVVQTVLPVKVDSGGTMLDDSDTLLGLLYSINSGGGTPLRRGLEAVGRYFDADDGQTGGLGDTPYVSSASGECQQAFAIVMTDGYYNGYDPYGTIGTNDNADGDDNTAFDGGCFADTSSNTLADIAMHYYERDLSASLNNLVPVGGNDTARHQHMVTYTISFGVFGSIDPADWPNCPNTCPNPWPGTGTNQGKIDDMYHAAVNGRGEYLSAENPQALVDALQALQTAIEERIGSGASVSINSQQLSTGAVLFQGRYDTNTWSGDIRAYELDPNTGELAPTYTWSAHERLELMDWNTDREIITHDGTSGIPFRSAEINTAGMLSLLDADSAKASAIVDFIRGDDSNEQDQGGTYSFRARGSKLGDIVHSSPLLAGNMLYVGSNNGMLHAFDVATGDEIFAYVPRLVFESLNKLTVENPNYAHTYFIDQSPYIANVGGSSLLVNTLGKGGKGVYCLDITDITNAELNANSIFKWEYPDSTDPDNSSDPDMGYGFSRAFIVDSNAGPVVIFSNGYDSTNEKAVLFILNPADGSVLKKIDTLQGSPGPGGDCNGLSNPALIDIDMDQKVDFAYAGDLLGNMWKFDLRDSDVNNWFVGYSNGSPQPLFQAKNVLGHRQPITMKPDIMRHCMANRAGYMVLFGTGRHLGNADFADNSVQTLYGIWDWQDAWEAAGLNGLDKSLGSFTPTRKLSNLDGNVTMPPYARDVTLLEQTQIFFGTEFGEQFRVISDNKPKWYSPAEDDLWDPDSGHAGWYFDLPANSERAFKDVLIYGGVNIAISSIPSDSPCSAGGDSILHAMDACTGARLDTPFYEVNNDGVIDSDDLINIGSLANPIWAAPTGWFKSGMYYPPAILSLGDGQSMLYFGTSDATVDPTRTVSEPLGLTNWREIE